MQAEWEAVGDHTTWRAQQIKDKLTSQAKDRGKQIPCHLLILVLHLAPSVWSAWNSYRYDRGFSGDGFYRWW